MLTRRLLSSLPLSAAVRQFWCHDRWYQRSDLWIQLAVHRRCRRLCRYGYSTLALLTVSSLPWVGSTPAGRQPRRVRWCTNDLIYGQYVCIYRKERSERPHQSKRPGALKITKTRKKRNKRPGAPLFYFCIEKRPGAFFSRFFEREAPWGEPTTREGV